MRLKICGKWNQAESTLEDAVLKVRSMKDHSATDAEDFWALANYDRFKGSRKANVEVHGGATLEKSLFQLLRFRILTLPLK